ncbi:MAG: ABC transporter ATP-binding protein [Bacteroidetes bacterium]|nr:ABC transporter ATP-binding protein [Bacteroidota bacterium]
MKLTIENVSKVYKGEVWGLKDFTLELNSGVLGLLGPNGAGKSTLMRILATITKPTKGSVYWNDKDITKHPDELRSVLGYLPQDFNVYPNLNALEFLEYMAAIKGLDKSSSQKRINELLQILNLFDNRKKLLGGFSGGMRQRVGIAQALLNDPKLLIVDEPTAGLDPEERVRFRGLISELSSNRIVILSSHIVSDVEATSMNIALIKKGELVKCDLPEELVKEMDGKVWELLAPSESLVALKEKFIISSTLRRKEEILVRIISNNKPSENAGPVAAKLEDAYLYLINSSDIDQRFE